VRVNIARNPVYRLISQINRLSTMLMMMDVMTGMKILTFPRSITISPGSHPSPSFSAKSQAAPIATRMIPTTISVFAISFSLQRTCPYFFYTNHGAANGLDRDQWPAVMPVQVSSPMAAVIGSAR
jgi:hypothetical protein